MKIKRRLTKSELFLIEVTLAVLVFIFVSAICVWTFGKSYALSEDATELSVATERCEDVAELTHASGSFEEFCELIEKIFPEGVVEGTDNSKVITVSYDKDFVPGETENPVYELIIDAKLLEDVGQDISTYAMMVKHGNEGDEEIYSLSSIHHIVGKQND